MLDHSMLIEHGARLARRGLEMTVESQGSGGEKVALDLPPWVIAVLASMLAVAILGLASVSLFDYVVSDVC
jgi:hypothetical protein